MKREFEAIVLGLGGIGSASVYWLSKSLGGDVLGIEQFELGHERGGSQDHSRIIRYSYHAPEYVELAKLAYQAWGEVEAESQEQVVVKTGGVDLFPPGCANTLSDYTGSLDSGGIDFEVLAADEIRRRWPQFRISDETEAIYQKDGGLVRAAIANATHRRLAEEHGAVLCSEVSVTAIRHVNGEFEVETPEQTYRSRKLVIAAGAWTNQTLAHFGLELPLTVTREQVVYFEPTGRPEFSPARLPIWIWMEEPSFYGFPEIDGQGLKVAEDVGGYETTAESRNFDPEPENLARVQSFCSRHLPPPTRKIAAVKTCLYTMPPDRDFIVDAMPNIPECVVAVGAGHAFKFASALGRILSELALDRRTAADLSRFHIDRPILQEENPPRSFFI